MHRRHLLASTGALTGVSAVGLAGCLERDDQFQFVEEIDGGASHDPTAWNEIHVDVRALGALGSDDPGATGVIRGLEQLAIALGSWFGGYRIRVFETRASLTCRDERIGQVETLLEADGADPDILHHVLHGCNGYLSAAPCNSCRRTRGSAWGPGADAGYRITTNSAYNKLYLRRRYMVRSVHHVCHAFVTGETARAAAGLDPGVSSYDAEHRLGTIRPDGDRTVMADRYAYRDDAAAGACGAAVSPWRSTWPVITDLGFSDCTLEALELTATGVRDGA